MKLYLNDGTHIDLHSGNITILDIKENKSIELPKDEKKREKIFLFLYNLYTSNKNNYLIVIEEQSKIIPFCGICYYDIDLLILKNNVES